MGELKLENNRFRREPEASESKVFYRAYPHRKIVGVFDFSMANATFGPLFIRAD